MGHKLIKILLRVGIILVALVVVFFVIRAVFNYSAGGKLENFLDRMKAEGIPLSLKDIEPECDPRYNAALDWKKAEASFSIEAEERELLGQIIEDFFNGRSMDEGLREPIQDLADKNREALDFILEASSKTCFKSQDGWGGYDLKVQKLIQMVQGIRLLGIDAVLKAENGHMEEAISQCLAAKRFLELNLQEPFIINYLVNMACMKQVAVCLNYIVSDREIETEILEKILEEWDDSPWKEGLVWVLQSEDISQLESAILYLRGENDLYLGTAGETYYWLFRPVLKNEIIWLPKVFNRLIETVEMPYYASRDSKELEKIMDEIPVDPFTGNPYVYRKEVSGFIVYSVGSNQKDEGGRGTWTITQMVMEKDDDWVWREESEKK